MIQFSMVQSLQRRARLCGILICLSAPAFGQDGSPGSLSGGASAQPAASQAARKEFEIALQLMDQKRFAEACPRFEASVRLDRRSSNLLNLADCYEKQGRIASARATFEESAALANSEGKLPRETEARGRAASLDGVVSRIMLQLPEGAARQGLEIQCDNRRIPPEEWAAGIPVDGGEHLIQVSAPGREPGSISARIKDRGDTVTLVIPELAPVRPIPAAPAPSSAPTGRAPVASSALLAPAGSADRPGPRALGTQRTVAVIAGGVGVVGIVLGSALGLRSKSKRDAAETYCDYGDCRDEQGVELRQEAKAAGNLATAAFTVGAIGLASGAALWFVKRPRSGAPVPATVGLRLAPASIQLQGAW